MYGSGTGTGAGVWSGAGSAGAGSGSGGGGSCSAMRLAWCVAWCRTCSHAVQGCAEAVDGGVAEWCPVFADFALYRDEAPRIISGHPPVDAGCTGARQPVAQ